MNSQLIQQGRAAYRAGDFSAAAQMLGAAKTPDEIMGEADHLRGNALMHLGMYAEAAEAYAAALNDGTYGKRGALLLSYGLSFILNIILFFLSPENASSTLVLALLFGTGIFNGFCTALLYGMIGTSGLRILVDSKVDYSKNRNQMLTSVIFVTGLSGAALRIGNIELTGMVLACVVGMAMSLVFYVLDRLKLTNDQAE